MDSENISEIKIESLWKGHKTVTWYYHCGTQKHIVYNPIPNLPLKNCSFLLQLFFIHSQSEEGQWHYEAKFSIISYKFLSMSHFVTSKLLVNLYILLNYQSEGLLSQRIDVKMCPSLSLQQHTIAYACLFVLFCFGIFSIWFSYSLKHLVIYELILFLCSSINFVSSLDWELPEHRDFVYSFAIIASNSISNSIGAIGTINW